VIISQMCTIFSQMLENTAASYQTLAKQIGRITNVCRTLDESNIEHFANNNLVNKENPHKGSNPPHVWIPTIDHLFTKSFFELGECKV